MRKLYTQAEVLRMAADGNRVMAGNIVFFAAWLWLTGCGCDVPKSEEMNPTLEVRRCETRP